MDPENEIEGYDELVADGEALWDSAAADDDDDEPAPAADAKAGGDQGVTPDDEPTEGEDDGDESGDDPETEGEGDEESEAPEDESDEEEDEPKEDEPEESEAGKSKEAKTRARLRALEEEVPQLKSELVKYDELLEQTLDAATAYKERAEHAEALLREHGIEEAPEAVEARDLRRENERLKREKERGAETLKQQQQQREQEAARALLGEIKAEAEHFGIDHVQLARWYRMELEAGRNPTVREAAEAFPGAKAPKGAKDDASAREQLEKNRKAPRAKKVGTRRKTDFPATVEGALAALEADGITWG